MSHDMEHMKFIVCPSDKAHEINVYNGGCVLSVFFYTTAFKPFKFLFILDHWMANLQADLHAFFTFVTICILDLLSTAVLLAGCVENTNNYCECHANFHSTIWSNLFKYN